MTSRQRTGYLPLGEQRQRPWRERARVIAWAPLQAPWLAKSLWGGRKAHKRALLDRLGLPHDALPHLGSWKADTGFLWRIVETIERLRPQSVVELGCGASTLVIARALKLNGGGRLMSFDQHADFVDATRDWLGHHGLAAELHYAPIRQDRSDWSSEWYDLPIVPDDIDLLVIDGPPWTINPTVRGRAELLFDSIAPGGLVLLDDAARPGERVVARRWRRRWPDFDFRLAGGIKGTLIGERLR